MWICRILLQTLLHIAGVDIPDFLLQSFLILSNMVKIGRGEHPRQLPISRAVTAEMPFWRKMAKAASMISSLVNFAFGGMICSFLQQVLCNDCFNIKQKPRLSIPNVG